MKSPKKSLIMTRNVFYNSPIKSFHRMKSTSPIKFKRFISCNNLEGLYKDKISNKNSIKECFSIKKNYWGKMNTRIPEESESSYFEKGITGKETKNNNYYINYIKNIYENEPHLNKETFIKTPSHKIMNIDKVDDSSGKLIKRRFSAFSDQFLRLNFHKKFCAEKGQHISSPIHKKLKSENLNNLIKKKKSNEIDILRKHSSNLSKSKNKSKHKSKGISKDKNKNNDKKSKNNIQNKKNKENKEKIKTKDNDIENSTKVESVNNNKIKNKTIKFFLCCLVNDNELS